MRFLALLEMTLGALEMTLGALEMTLGALEMTLDVLEMTLDALEMTPSPPRFSAEVRRKTGDLTKNRSRLAMSDKSTYYPFSK